MFTEATYFIRGGILSHPHVEVHQSFRLAIDNKLIEDCTATLLIYLDNAMFKGTVFSSRVGLNTLNAMHKFFETNPSDFR